MSFFKKNQKFNNKELLKADLLRTFRVDQKFHLNDHHNAFAEKALEDETNTTLS